MKLNNSVEEYLNSDSYKKIQKTIKAINEMAATIQNASKEAFEALKPLSEAIKKQNDALEIVRKSIKPIFVQISKALDNPNSAFSYYEYYRVLSKYFWVLPYKIEPSHLKAIIKICSSEEEFDKFMLEYFTDELVLELKDQTMEFLPKKHCIIFNQSINSFNRNDYALCCLGLFSIIDDVLSFYVKDKGNVHRANILQPIVDDVINNESTNEMCVEHFVLMMMNENVKTIYEKVDFNIGCDIHNQKGVSRNASSHGKSYSDRKESSLMLLNSLYYLLVIQNCFGEYKERLSFDKKKKAFFLIS